MMTGKIRVIATTVAASLATAVLLHGAVGSGQVAPDAAGTVQLTEVRPKAQPAGQATQEQRTTRRQPSRPADGGVAVGICGNPAAGDCCVSNGSPFCNSETCCNEICALDPFCCNNTWDQVCANEAAADQVNCPQCIAPPPNDECAGAIPIGNGTTLYDTSGATFDTTDCFNPGFPSVYYNYTANFTGFLTISACDDVVFNAIEVYDGCGCPTNVGNQLACESGNVADPACGGVFGTRTDVTFPVVNGGCYKIRLTTGLTSTGTITITKQQTTGACCFKDGTCQDETQADCAALGGTYQGDGTDCATTACPPANDNCGNAIPIAPNSVTSGTTTAATFDGAPFCGTSNTAPGVWYSVIGTGTDITATTCGTECSGAASATYDTKINVYRDGCGTLTCVTGIDDNCPGGPSGLLSTVTWCAEVGVEYLVLAHGFSSQSGDFVLELCKAGPCLAGACCLWDGSCVDVASQADCDALVGVFQGVGTTCAGVNCPPPPQGANFFLDPAAFDAALADAGKGSKVSWDFAPNNVPPGSGWPLDDPVNINSHAGAFGDPWAPPAFWPPEVDNITFQSNLGPHPQPPLPNPQGVDGLGLGNAFPPFDNNILIANFFVDSFDIISGPPAGDNHTAMSLDLVTFQGAGLIFVTVYDKNEQVVGKTKVNIAAGQKVFLGILMEGSFTIGRVNLWDPGNGGEGISAFTLYECTCPADLDGDCAVDFTDLALLLTSWAAGTTQGDIGGPGGCAVPDGVTDFFDLSCLLAAWAAGGCP